MDNNLGRIISELRNKKGITQKELANALHVSDKTVSHWETGDNLPQIDMLNHISKYFKVPLHDLIAARVSNESNDKLVNDIITSYEKTNRKMFKIIRLIFGSALIIILALLMTMIFTRSYNRFKVFNVEIKSKDIYEVRGVYIETITR